MKEESTEQINVLIVSMKADAIDDKEIGDAIAKVIQLIDEKGYLLTHTESIRSFCDVIDGPSS